MSLATLSLRKAVMHEDQGLNTINTVGNLLPKYDTVFKRIFGDAKHANVLISFLNAIVECNQPITSIEIKNSEIIPEHVDDKWSRLDILATTNDKEIINIEIQVRDQKDITARALFYWSKLFGSQLNSGEPYSELKRTITINILDFNQFKDDRYWHKGMLTDTKDHMIFSKLLEVHFLELRKMLGARGKSTTLEMWLKFLNNPYSEEVNQYAKEIPAIAEAQEIFSRVNYDPIAREEWRNREKSIHEEASALAEAREDGKAEGRQEGIQKGMQEGRQEGQAILIKQLLASGISITQVATITKMTSDAVERLALMNVETSD
jgi:predicted transposase/invertase (TIGR01784 family)